MKKKNVKILSGFVLNKLKTESNCSVDKKSGSHPNYQSRVHSLEEINAGKHRVERILSNRLFARFEKNKNKNKNYSSVDLNNIKSMNECTNNDLNRL